MAWAGGTCSGAPTPDPQVRVSPRKPTVVINRREDLRPYWRKLHRLLALALIAFAASFVFEWLGGREARALRADGVPTTAMVVQVTRSQASSSPARRGRAGRAGGLEISYFAGGRRLTAEIGHVSRSQHRYRSGQKIGAYYDRTDPTRVAISGEDNPPAWATLARNGLRFGAFGAVALWAVIAAAFVVIGRCAEAAGRIGRRA